MKPRIANYVTAGQLVFCTPSGTTAAKPMVAALRGRYRGTQRRRRGGAEAGSTDGSMA